MTFSDLGLIEPLCRAVAEEGYTHPTPIQEQSIPALLEGHDLLGAAQTGTGKTAAFSLPILQHLHAAGVPSGKRRIRAVVVAPTRELAIQIGDSFTAYGRHTGLTNTVIFGGVKQGAQVDALKRGVDILVATPGRLLDLLDQGFISFGHVTHAVLDEADRMLDMGFIHDVKKIIAALPPKRQSLFFSATLPPDIVALSKRMLGQDTVEVHIAPEKPTAEKVDQAVYFVGKKDKPKLLAHLIREKDMEAVLVFSRTKHGANKIVRKLEQSGIKAAAIHGNKSQPARQQALGAFKDGKLPVLVATDIAARGIDVDDLSWVINYDLPNVPETYVHRIGRTGRARASGTALSFCDGEERAYLKDIQKLIRQTVPVVEDHPWPDDGSVPPPDEQARQGSQRPGRAPREDRAPRRERDDAEARPARAPKAKKTDRSEKPERGADGERPRRRRENKPAAWESGGPLSPFNPDARYGEGVGSGIRPEGDDAERAERPKKKRKPRGKGGANRSGGEGGRSAEGRDRSAEARPDGERPARSRSRKRKPRPEGERREGERRSGTEDRARSGEGGAKRKPRGARSGERRDGDGRRQGGSDRASGERSGARDRKADGGQSGGGQTGGSGSGGGKADDGKKGWSWWPFGKG